LGLLLWVAFMQAWPFKSFSALHGRARSVSPLTGVVFGLAMIRMAGAAADTEQRASVQLRDGPAGYTFACAIRTSAGVPGVRLCSDLGAAQRCQHESDFASHPTQQRTRLTIVNRSAEVVKLYWLDREGTRALYGTIAPGGRVNQDTRIGASWVVASGDGQCLGVFNAAPVSIAFF
jgi:hypothetical protein